MTTRLNKQDLAAKLVEAEVVATKKQGVETIDALTDIIMDTIVAGDSIALAGFGKFSLYTRMNGATKPKFTPFDQFKDRANG